MKMFDKNKLTSQLSSLPSKYQLLFGVSCCQRMLYSYQCFLKDINKNEEDKISPLLKDVWEYFLVEDSSGKDWDLLADIAYSLIPNSEDFETDLTGYAQNACISVYYLLHCLNSNQLDKIVNIAVFIIDTADWIVQDNLSASGLKEYTEYDIESHEIMQKELNHQHTDLVLLEQNSKLNPELIKTIYDTSESAQLNPRISVIVEGDQVEPPPI